MTWNTTVCCSLLSSTQSSLGWIGEYWLGSAAPFRGGLCVIGGHAFLIAYHQQIFLQELSQSRDRNGKRIERRRIIFQIGRCHRHMPFNGGTNPDNAAPATLRGIGDAKTGERSPKKWVSWI